jgi:hypothetical protein
MIKSLISNLLISNYFLAQISIEWQEDKIFPTAVSTTCRQLYYFVMTLFIGVYPPVKSIDQVFIVGIFAVILTYTFLQPFRNVIFKLFRRLDILQQVQLQTAGPLKTIYSICITGIGLITFAIAVAIKIAGYIQH